MSKLTTSGTYLRLLQEKFIFILLLKTISVEPAVTL